MHSDNNNRLSETTDFEYGIELIPNNIKKMVLFLKQYQINGKISDYALSNKMEPTVVFLPKIHCWFHMQ